MRRQYWIVGVRRIIKQVIRQCTVCRRYTGQVMQGPPVALPLSRVRDSTVFETVGVDLACPLILKKGQKAWIVLYTCAVYRAVHLEIVTSLSADAFMQCLRRFVARRGRPKIIYSDNATNFKKTADDLTHVNWAHIASTESTYGIEWQFNVPSAPWWGGWWERLIRVIKDLLRKTLGRASLNFEEMSTAVCEAEAVINARSLTYFSDEDRLIPLTPATFLQDIQEIGMPDIETIDNVRLQKRVRYRRQIAAELRRRFREEYLGQLKMPRKKGQMSPSLKEGDVVLIADDNRKRVLWSLGRIIEMYPGKDGKVRCVKVKTEKGFLLKPIQKLVQLELPNEHSNVKEDKSQVEEELSRENINTTKATQNEYRTRSGRLVKIPQKIDLLNQEMYQWEFESFPKHSNRGEC